MELDRDFSEFIASCAAHSVQRRVEVEFGGQRVPFISAGDLLVNKKASGRLQDLADVAAIEEQPGNT